MLAAVSASISTPVCPVVLADAMMRTALRSASGSKSTLALVSAIG